MTASYRNPAERKRYSPKAGARSTPIIGVSIGGSRMKRYNVKCRSGHIEFIDILREVEDGYLIRLTRISDGNKKISEESMTRHLFDICLKTGYLSEIESVASSEPAAKPAELVGSVA
jgi:hypothetical protein